MRTNYVDASFRAPDAIPLDYALSRFPALRTASPAPDRSAKYAHITTGDVLTALDSEGFKIHGVNLTRSRDENRRPFVKHLVRMRHVDARGFDGVMPEICLLNSHDGRSAYKIFSGAFRFICMNGLILGDILDAATVHHSGDVAAKVIDASYRVVSQVATLESQVDSMRARFMLPEERQEFAARALAVRYGDNVTPFNAREVGFARRAEDTGADLWSVFNRAQENLLRGGLTGFAPGSNGRVRRHTMRAITGVDADTRINRGLWNLAASYLPSGAPMPKLIAA